jgi:MFS family permease
LFGGLTTDRLTRRYGVRIGRAVVGAGGLFAAGAFMIGGAFAGNPLASAVLISLAGAASNFILAAAWGSCIDLGGRHSGVLSAAMNTAGQVGGFLSPIVLAFLVQRFTSWSAPLYITGGLYIAGSLCWIWIDPSRRSEALQ